MSRVVIRDLDKFPGLQPVSIILLYPRSHRFCLGAVTQTYHYTLLLLNDYCLTLNLYFRFYSNQLNSHEEDILEASHGLFFLWIGVVHDGFNIKFVLFLLTLKSSYQNK